MYEEIKVSSYQTKKAPWFMHSLTEMPRTLVEFGSLTMLLPWISGAGKGDGHPVLVLPGFMASDESTWLLRQFIKRLGYEPRGWGFGTNDASAQVINSKLPALLQELNDLHESQVSIIGHSLGGVYGLYLARYYPHLVRQVITLGSPIAHTGPGQMRSPVPLTALYSKGDGVVHWEKCMKHVAEGQIENIEVIGSHCGMTFNPQVYSIIANRLAPADDGREANYPETAGT